MRVKALRLRHAGGESRIALSARHGFDAGTEGFGEVSARLQCESKPAGVEERVGKTEHFRPNVSDPHQLYEDRRVAEELDQQDRDRTQRRDVEARQAQHQPADDRGHERDGANLDRNAEACEQNVALIPDEALPVAHRRYAMILRRQRSLKCRTPTDSRKMMRK